MRNEMAASVRDGCEVRAVPGEVMALVYGRDERWENHIPPFFWADVKIEDYVDLGLVFTASSISS